jgi:hypothetical protein
MQFKPLSLTRIFLLLCACGLTKLANVATLNPAKQTMTGQSGELKEHNTEITVPAGGGLECKINMLKGDAIRYSWQSTGGELFFDFNVSPKAIRLVILKAIRLVHPMILSEVH